jgi:hypothetical protein
MRKALRVILWVIGAVVALPIVLSLVVLAINFRDRPPSADALALAAPLRGAAEVADADNAYVYLLGFGAPRDGDPAVIGAARAAWLRKMRDDESLPRDLDPYRRDAPDIADLFTSLQELLKPCGERRDADCFEGLDGSRAKIDATVADAAWLVDRYGRLLAHRAWADVTSNDIPSTHVGYAPASNAHLLFLLHAWSLAAAGDGAGVRDALDADLELWRLGLRSSDSVLGKMIATRYIGASLEWGNLILRRLPASARTDAVPPSWRQPLSDEERSLARAFRGEWNYRQHLLRNMKVYGSLFPTVGPRLSVGERFSNVLMRTLLQPQDSANQDAALVLRVDALLDGPYAGLPAALVQVSDVVKRPPSGIVDTLYNVAGDLILGSVGEQYADYGARVADLEGMRRAALLAADLRARGIPADSVTAFVTLDGARNPYTGEAFEWIVARKSIDFRGLRHEYRGRSEFLY